MNLLHFDRCKTPTCFGHLCCHIQAGVYIEGCVADTTKPMYSYEILSFKYVIHNIL